MRTCVVVAFCMICGFCFAESGGIVGKKPRVLVENRVLAHCRDQVITVVDVAKKLDMIFYQQFAQYRSNPEVRYEFYRANWKKALDELIERRLAILLAEEKQIPLSNGDIRQELEAIYGPNVLLNLHEEGISLEEAQKMMREDILYRRIVSFFVQMPIYTAITPLAIKKAYEEKKIELAQQKGWVWRSITLKGKPAVLTQEVAERIYTNLIDKRVKLRELLENSPEGINISVSSSYRSYEKDLSEGVFSILKNLPLAVFSKPLPVVLREKELQGFRMYIVDEVLSPVIPPLHDIEEELRGDIAFPILLEKSQQFFLELRKQYQVTYALPEKDLLALEPFFLKTSESKIAYVSPSTK